MTRIFVFGSNLAGIHGAGSALEARKNWGAIYGNGTGLQGKAYAIPTKGYDLEVLTLAQIQPFVNGFLAYAWSHSELQFEVVDIGCGLAGYHPKQIAPMFKNAPENVTFLGKLKYFVTQERLKDNPSVFKD